MAAALLRFNCNYGDFVRWLGGEYTGAQRDWDATFDIVDSVRTSLVPPGYPAIDFDRAVRLATEGAPLACHFECSFAAVQQRKRHDNASLTPEAIAHVRKKYAKEEKLSNHILYPRFIWAFIPRLFLFLITWIPPKGRLSDDGRLCVDPSTILDNKGDAAGTPDGGAAKRAASSHGSKRQGRQPPPPPSITGQPSCVF